MDSLISRQAAIDAVMAYDFKCPQYMKRFVTELRDAMKADLIDDIQELPSAQPEPQWIPCSERLPEEYGNYLVSIEGEETDIGSIDPKVGRWSLCDATGFYWADNLHVKITAWCELPEPYKGE